MPHQCTDCSRQFDDGSKEMLSGCPDCGGNKFQFLPSSAAGSLDQAADSQSDSPATQQPTPDDSGAERSVARTVGNAVRKFVGGGSETQTEQTPVESASPTQAESASTTQTETTETGPTQTETTETGPTQTETGTTAQQTATQETPAQTASESAQSNHGSLPSDRRSPDDQHPVSTNRSSTERSRVNQPNRQSKTGDQRTRSQTEPDGYGFTPSETSHRNSTASETTDEPTPETETVGAKMAETENAAQASARSEIISPEDLPPVPDRTSNSWSDSTIGASASGTSGATGRSTGDVRTEPGSTPSPDQPNPTNPTNPTSDQSDSVDPTRHSEPTDSTSRSVPTDPTSHSDTPGISDTPDISDTPEISDTPDTPEQETDRPDLSELRAELNQQFESIKVVEPGQYELNLMELYDRQEYIVALQEDGKYTVQVPENWQE